MRAITIDAHGGLEQLVLRDDLAIPELHSSRDVRIRIQAAALNHLDLWTLGGLPGLRIAPGWVLGADGMGVVDAVGGEVSEVQPGDRVFINPGVSCRRCEYCRAGEHPLCLQYQILGEHRPGTLAEYVVVPAANVRRIRDDVSDEIAAAFPLVTLTAWRACVTRAQVRPGDEVLIWGIGGGVALAALLVCKRLGARVWVTSRSEHKLERARQLGADETLLQAPGVDIGREIRQRTGKRGVDVVVESVGSATWNQSLAALGRRGRLVCFGGTSGADVQLDVRKLFWNQWTILGSTMGNDAEFDAVTREFNAGKLTAVVDSVYSMEDAREAFARLESGQQFGKVVVRIS
jgi:NADPH:quinone reductase-like Zn-dependent oxidoreductase